MKWSFTALIGQWINTLHRQSLYFGRAFTGTTPVAKIDSRLQPPQPQSLEGSTHSHWTAEKISTPSGERFKGCYLLRQKAAKPGVATDGL